MEINYELEEKLMEAAFLIEKENFKKAENAFAKIVKDFPSFAIAWMAYGEFYIHQNKPTLAVKLLRKAILIAPEEGMINFILGVALCRCARFYLGLKYLENAGRLMPNNPEIKRNVGFAKVMLGQIEEGRDFLRHAIKLEPLNALAYMDLAMSYMKVCDYDEALKCLETAKGFSPGDEFILANLKEARKAKREFSKLTPKQKEKYFKTDPFYHKKIRIELLMASLDESPVSSEDLKDIIEEFKSEGLAGEIAMLHDPKTPNGKAAIRYMNAHGKFLDKNLTEEEIKRYEKKLFDKKTITKEKEKILIILAHQKKKKALEILEKYSKEPDAALRIWAKMATDECKGFLEGNGKQEIQIHRIDE